MPHSVMVSEVFLGEDQEPRVSMDDLRNFYHMIEGSRGRVRSNPVGPPFEAGIFRGCSAWGWSVGDQERLHVCWCGLGMGDLHAVDLA